MKASFFSLTQNILKAWFQRMLQWTERTWFNLTCLFCVQNLIDSFSMLIIRFDVYLRFRNVTCQWFDFIFDSYENISTKSIHFMNCNIELPMNFWEQICYKIAIPWSHITRFYLIHRYNIYYTWHWLGVMDSPNYQGWNFNH